MGNTLARLSKNGWIAWQHRAIIPNNPQLTAKGEWILYMPEVCDELEAAFKDESKEPIHSLSSSHVYNGDQILFNGDLSARLGGPFVHRNKDTKELKELRRIAYGYVLTDKTSFDYNDESEIPDKAVLLTADSTNYIFAALRLLINRDFDCSQPITPEDGLGPTHPVGFVPVQDSSIYTQYTSKLPSAEQKYYQLNVTDTNNKIYTIIVQQHDVDLLTTEAAISYDIQNIDSKLASLYINEARISLATLAISRNLLIIAGNGQKPKGGFTRREAILESTASRKK